MYQSIDSIPILDVADLYQVSDCNVDDQTPPTKPGREYVDTQQCKYTPIIQGNCNSFLVLHILQDHCNMT